MIISDNILYGLLTIRKRAITHYTLTIGSTTHFLLDIQVWVVPVIDVEICTAANGHIL